MAGGNGAEGRLIGGSDWQQRNRQPFAGLPPSISSIPVTRAPPSQSRQVRPTTHGPRVSCPPTASRKATARVSCPPRPRRRLSFPQGLHLLHEGSRQEVREGLSVRADDPVHRRAALGAARCWTGLSSRAHQASRSIEARPSPGPQRAGALPVMRLRQMFPRKRRVQTLPGTTGRRRGWRRRG